MNPRLEELKIAINESNIDKVRTLIVNEQVDPNAEIPGTNYTVLGYCLAQPNPSTEIIRFLIARGVNINSPITTVNHLTPLITMINQPYHHITLLLLELGANPNQMTSADEAPLIRMCFTFKNLMLLEAFLKYGSNPNAFIPDYLPIYKKTLLGYAVIINNIEMVTILLKYHANPFIKMPTIVNKMHGEFTAYEIAKTLDYEEIASLLDNAMKIFEKNSTLSESELIIAQSLKTILLKNNRENSLDILNTLKNLKNEEEKLTQLTGIKPHYNIKKILEFIYKDDFLLMIAKEQDLVEQLSELGFNIQNKKSSLYQQSGLTFKSEIQIQTSEQSTQTAVTKNQVKWN